MIEIDTGGCLDDLSEATGKIKNYKDSKETLPTKEKRPKEDDRLIPSKQNSLNHLNKKTSKADISHDIYHINHKLSDNYMVDTQEETRF